MDVTNKNKSKKLKKRLIILEPEAEVAVAEVAVAESAIAEPAVAESLEKVKRCPKGTRRNKKTGLCEPNNVIAPAVSVLAPASVAVAPSIAAPMMPSALSKNAVVSAVEKVKRCPKGTRKNKKTGLCEPNNVLASAFANAPANVNAFIAPPPVAIATVIAPASIVPMMPSALSKNAVVSAVEKVKRCPKGTRKNKKTGLCEPNNVLASAPVVPAVPMMPSVVPIMPSAVSKNVVVPAVEKVKRCPKGTKKNKKTGLCEPNNVLASAVVAPKTINASLSMPAEIDVDVDVPVSAPVFAVALGTQASRVAPLDAPLDAPLVELADLPEKDKNDLKVLNDIRNEKEINEWNEMMNLKSVNDEYSYLYPNLNDPNFNIKIAERKEFNDNKYDGKIYNVKEHSDILCKAEFELAPQQLFVRNFLSLQTPYNSLLLYHGLGSGKTCSAISVAEEMREYNKQMGIGKRIIVVASPNVQENFKVQLFDESKLKLINGLWNISSCTGNKLLKEINPMNMSGLTKENVVSQIKQIISKYYAFMGYTGFANYIIKSSMIETRGLSNEKRELLIKKKLQKEFDNRLIIIDEVHNIRLTDDNLGSKRIAQELFKLVSNVENLRLLLLSATPMYNSYKEIIWLLNLMNLNDKRSEIKTSDVFDEYGNFKMGQDGVEEIGKELLERKATGYISYVRGENPYTFPYRLWPKDFSPENTFGNANLYPRTQINGMPIVQGIERVSLFLVNIGEYQQKGYDCFIKKISEGKSDVSFDNMEAFGYTILQKPLQALNMIYPSEELDEIIEKMDNPSYENINTSDLVGEGGLNRLMTFDIMPYNKENGGSSFRYNFDYQPELSEKYGKIFSPTEIGKYSGKIKNICSRIMNSSGIVMIYTQYIDGGAIPVALALEEMGFTRGDTQLSLFKTRKPAIKKIDAITFKTEEDHKKHNAGETASISPFSPAKYIMITGDKGLSPNNAEILKKVNDESNKDGRKIKVVIISAAGSEGLDYKCIRQVHVMDPWYNMSRIEQIIGRAVRTCSHKNLPFEKRNVEIYLYGSLMNGEEKAMKEAVDLYVYRLSELKAVQIGNVSRVLKEVSIDCILNYEQASFTVENMDQEVELELSSKPSKKIMYAIGDKPFSATCDYSDNCNYTCRPNKNLKDEDVKLDTYNEDFIMTNNDKIVQKIKKLMKEKFFYRKADMLIQINLQKVYPLVQINAALNFLVEDKYEYITDKYGRLGNLINIDDLYLFQPLEIKNPKISLHDRSVPIEFKRDNLAYKLPKVVKEIAIKPGKKVVVEEIANANPIINDIAKAKKDKALLKLLDQLKTKYNNAANNTIKNASGRGEEDWYKLCSIVIELMEEENVSDRDTLLELLIDHIMDEIKIDDFRVLLTSLNTLDVNDDFESYIKKYIEKNIIISDNDNSGIFVNNITNDENQLLIKSGGENEWTFAKPMDITDFAPKIEEIKNKFVKKMNNLIGFMGEFKKDGYMVYKLKDLSNKKNKGARCDQSGKTALPNLHKIIDSLNDEHEENYDGFMDKVQKLNHKQICIIQEMILRLFTYKKYNNKVWFLSAVEANLINIENMKI